MRWQWRSVVPEREIFSMVSHGIATIVAMIVVWFVGQVGKWLYPEGVLHTFLAAAEDFVLMGVVILFARELLVRLWNARTRLGETSDLLLV